MKLNEIKKAVDSGIEVRWNNNMYHVRKDNNGDYYIICIDNNSIIGLTHKDEVTLNGKEEEFYVLPDHKLLYDIIHGEER